MAPICHWSTDGYPGASTLMEGPVECRVHGRRQPSSGIHVVCDGITELGPEV
jgi:hypothetical protein